MHKLANAFDKVNRIRCFNHTMQLSVKALLRPFASTTEIDTNDNITEDNMDDEPPPLEWVEDDVNEDDGDSEEGIVNDDGLGGAQVDDDDDKVNDDLDLDEEERKALMDNTASVRSILDKVSFLPPLSFWMNTDMILLIRSVNSLLQLFTQQPLSFLPGVKHAPLTLTRFVSFLVMSRHAGIQLTICLRLLMITVL
jgi:hypothetical protein